ncbi:2-polyprenyl-6-methoxyphenol hydroxylase [Emydomyces testavorans]|uniref:2-polyprenyl-6-methoxyphenol hydroxylase n=1 Tax=Emydomyces testavorans TaxID=2070801 RepID=A0AAF0IL76_9EURO|nr:2-polyprenyl-6-methoxyphenol hydroxylase [Emydomyces testavorans]
MATYGQNRFRILIIGGGLGGLGAAICLSRKGHSVTVIEAANKLVEVGAGIHIPPNSTRVLDSYGLTEKFHEKAVWPKSLVFRRYCTGEVIGSTPFRHVLEKKYGFPYWLVHRADYQQILVDAVKESGAKIMLGAQVEYVDEQTPAAVLADGRRFTADLIIGADGIRSKTRRAVIREKEIEANDTPNCVFRVTVPAEVMNADDEVKHLMIDEDSNGWIGHQRSIMAYPIRQGTIYNLVLCYPGKASVGKWNEPGDPDEMRAYYGNFEPTIKKVLAKVKSCLKWKLAELPPLPSWVSPNGKVVLIGDAAHAMVPYLGQCIDQLKQDDKGAAMAIEDGAALGECLDRARSTWDIPKVLHAFEAIRKPRCERVQAVARENEHIWHLPDGPQQVARDRVMKQKAEEVKKETSWNPNRWSDEEFQPWLLGHDVFTYKTLV